MLEFKILGVLDHLFLQPFDLIAKPCGDFKLQITRSGVHFLFQVHNRGAQVMAHHVGFFRQPRVNGHIVLLVDAAHGIADS